MKSVPADYAKENGYRYLTWNGTVHPVEGMAWNGDRDTGYPGLCHTEDIKGLAA